VAPVGRVDGWRRDRLLGEEFQLRRSGFYWRSVWGYRGSYPHRVQQRRLRDLRVGLGGRAIRPLVRERSARLRLYIGQCDRTRPTIVWLG